MKRKIAITSILAFALVFMGVSFAQAQATATAGLTVNATISEFAALTLGGGSATTVNFANTDPGQSATVTAGPVAVSASFRTNGTATVYVLANTAGGLIGSAHASNVIPWSNISSTSSGSGFFAPGQGAAWTTTTPGVLVGTGTQSGVYTDSFTYTLQNSYNYNVDTYSGTATYTLTSP
jgi:hypothetical protein